MHSRLILGSLAVLGFLACSGEPVRGGVDTPSGPVDTAQPVPSALLAMAAAGPAEADGAWALRGFASHWAIFERAGETRLLHTTRGLHVDHEGVVVDDGNAAGDPLVEEGLLGNDDGFRPQLVGDRVLLRGLEGRLRILSLLSDDDLVQLWEDDGPTDAATLSGDGRFASWTNGDRTSVHVVDLDAGREVVVPVVRGEVSGLRWLARTGSAHPSAVAFADEAQAHVVDLDRDMKVTHVAAGGPFDFWPSPSDPSVLVLSEHVGSEDRVRVFRGDKGVASLPGAADDVLFDASGDRIAWVERRSTVGEPAPMHVTDTRTGADVRVRPSGDCSVGAERLVELDGGELVTDAECSPGCPSSASQPELRAYDARSGVLLRGWKGAEEPAWDDQVAALVSAVEEAAKAAGAPKGETLLAPARDVALVARAEGLVLVDAKTGAVRAVLEGSKGLRAEGARFSPDGALVAAAGVARDPAVWSAEDGHVVGR